MGGRKSKGGMLCASVPPYKHEVSWSEFKLIYQYNVRFWRKHGRKRAGFDPRVSSDKMHVDNMILQPWMCEGRQLWTYISNKESCQWGSSEVFVLESEGHFPVEMPPGFKQKKLKFMRTMPSGFEMLNGGLVKGLQVFITKYMGSVTLKILLKGLSHCHTTKFCWFRFI